MPLSVRALLTAALFVALASVAGAQGAKPLTKCAPDAVAVGTVCIDKYEASVWRVPNPTTTNKGLVKKIQQGKATLADLTKGQATALGITSVDYAPCARSGQNCTDDIYAVSLAGVKPSGAMSWFQAVAACENSRKRLPTNMEWQAAVVGTPDSVPDDGATDCNNTFQNEADDPTLTGSRSACRSAFGAFDMVGNLREFVADWLPRSTGCGGVWSEAVSPTHDEQCLVGAATTGEPGVLVRGGGCYNFAVTDPGPLAVNATTAPSDVSFANGFRCAR